MCAQSLQKEYKNYIETETRPLQANCLYNNHKRPKTRNHCARKGKKIFFFFNNNIIALENVSSHSLIFARL